MKTLMLALIALGLFVNAGILLLVVRPGSVHAATKLGCNGQAFPESGQKGSYSVYVSCEIPWIGDRDHN